MAEEDCTKSEMPHGLKSSVELYDALAEHGRDTLIMVDFDETLWLRNSTEEFLESVRPRFLAAFIVQLLGFVGPWRWFGRSASHYRDWMRIGAIVLFAPWSVPMWRRRAAELGPRHVNSELLAQLRSHDPRRVKIVSFGFGFIIRPLLSAVACEFDLAVSGRLRDAYRLRKMGKAAAVVRRFGAEALARSLVITDSRLDDDLLAASARPFLVVWPEAIFSPGAISPMMPFVYLARVKRPDERYFLRAIIGHDLIVALLCFGLVAEDVIAVSMSIFILVLSFFCSYEIGYYENDRVGALYEKTPKISPKYWSIGQNFSPAFAWACALVLAALGAFVAAPFSWLPQALYVTGITAFAMTYAAFVTLLVVVRLLFHFFNVLEPKGRIVPMLGLQLLRVIGYAMVFTTTVPGALYCAAHAFSRWIPYVVYRFDGRRERLPVHLLCLLMFVALIAVAAVSNESELLNWHAGVLLAYAGFRSAFDLAKFYPSMRRMTSFRPKTVGSEQPAEY